MTREFTKQQQQQQQQQKQDNNKVDNLTFIVYQKRTDYTCYCIHCAMYGHTQE